MCLHAGLPLAAIGQPASRCHHQSRLLVPYRLPPSLTAPSRAVPTSAAGVPHAGLRRQTPPPPARAALPASTVACTRRPRLAGLPCPCRPARAGLRRHLLPSIAPTPTPPTPPPLAASATACHRNFTATATTVAYHRHHHSSPPSVTTRPDPAGVVWIWTGLRCRRRHIRHQVSPLLLQPPPQATPQPDPARLGPDLATIAAALDSLPRPPSVGWARRGSASAILHGRVALPTPAQAAARQDEEGGGEEGGDEASPLVPPREGDAREDLPIPPSEDPCG